MTSADDRDGMLRYDQLAARVYSEHRMPSGTRDLILGLAWSTLRDPRRHDPAAPGVWARTRENLNLSNKQRWEMIADDAPRYEHDWHAGPQGCQAPMVRVDRLCGRSTSIGFAEFDPHTGWMTDWGFCSRPRCRAYMKPILERADRSKDRAPEPIPNTGGLLPLFFHWNWEAKYRKAMELIKHRSSWEPPSYGLSADQWPQVPGQEKPKAFPKLRLVTSNGEFIAHDAPALT
ncbi:hypothetical protein [Streptomyces nanshensis]|uniref:Uncharacterized protein n=1 Tax=Streptomyces nanshensis TaxID=518642 RepID=A0A1E7L591_9ACTN|nr:hypothetical protein [Streptomyces nanshensis]OEV11328.1 hypothetical protein AN218_13325 [Streptomyces nanshensis]